MKQTLVLIGFFMFLGLSVAIAYYFGGAGASSRSLDTGKRYKAPPGKTRKNAIALTSNKRRTTEDPEPTGAKDDGSSLKVKSLSDPSDEKRKGPGHEQATSAMNSVSTESGLREIKAALAMPHEREQAALLHEAEGQLYAQLIPPDMKKAKAAFDEALELADDSQLKQSILLKSVQVFMQAGLNAEARSQLEAGADTSELSDQLQFRLQLLEGQLEERAGRAEAAEIIYRRILDTALKVPDAVDRDTAVMFARMAGLRLSKLYRAHNREEAAVSLSKELQKQLKILAETI